MPPNDLVTADWLNQHLHDREIRIVDTRWVLQEPGQGRRQYEQGHIPGAIHLDIDTDLSAKEGPGRHPLPSRFNFQKLMTAIGVDRDTQVVAYDGGKGFPAARLWWLLRFYGHETVSVLDGGWEAWLRGGFPVQTDVPTHPTASFSARPRRKCVVDKKAVDSLRDETKTLLIDARAPERFRGEVEPIDAKPGHIPGAENFPFAQALDPQTGLFRSPESLREAFKGIGAAPDKTIICYCGSGVTACTNILALRLAGFEAQLYEGSWSDWSKDDSLSVATK